MKRRKLTEQPPHEVMTPQNPRWQEFYDKLQGPEGCNFTQTDPNDIKTVRWKCGGGKDKSLAEKILTAMGGISVPASLAYFESHGGYCDCEILFNVDKRVPQ